MTKTTEKELKKIAFADMTHYDEKTKSFIIPKYSKPVYSVGKCYLVEVSADIINNPNSVLATNWNNGRSPGNTHYKVCVNKSVGTFINVDAVAYDYINKKDLNTMWSGWLDINKLIQLEKI